MSMPFFRARVLLPYIFSLLCAFVVWTVFWFVGPTRGTSSGDVGDTEGSKAAVLFANQNNDDLTKAFSKAIEEAKESVLLIIYTLTDPVIIDALKSKSLEGVKVQVICDARESPPVKAKLGNKVRVIRRFSPGRMHQKILVVDGKRTWIGSANMTTESLRMHGNLVTMLDDSSLAKHILAKAETIKVEGHNQPFSHEHFNIGNQNIEMWFLPDDKLGVERVLNLIHSANKTIRIAMFTWTRRDLAEAVIEATKRGVKAEVVIDSYQGKGSGAKIVKMLKDGNVKIALSRGGPLLHHKFLYIDGETLVNGSANWTRDAFTKNDDCFIVINQLNTSQKAQMEDLWKVIDTESVPLQVPANR